MSPKKDTTRRKKEKIPIECKKEIIAKYEGGSRNCDLDAEYKRPASTIATIVKNKEFIKGADVARGVSTITKQRPKTLEEVEKLLYVWIQEKQLAGDSISQAIVCEKARQLHADLMKEKPTASGEISETFKASHGWFDNFRKRTGIHSVVRHGEAASSDKEAAETFVTDFKQYVEAEAFVPQQVFNCDETGLFWKKMPSRTYITQEKKTLPGHKAFKNRVTLLLCGNASGDLKIKPLLVYQSQNPRVFKRENIQKDRLSVMWRANKKAWMTQVIFTEWINEVFCPTVKNYLVEKELPLRALLIMDNAPAHPPAIEDNLPDDFKFIKRCFEVTSNTQVTLKQFWKNHFNILHCITLIDKAWSEVSHKSMNCCWRKLWTDAVAPVNLEAEPSPVVEEIVSLGKSMGLEVSADDINELVEEQREELSTEELQELQREQQERVPDDLCSSSEEEVREETPIALIEQMCAKWTELKHFVQHHHPDKAQGSRLVDFFDDQAMSPFRNILKRRQTQVSIDRFLVKVPTS
ncbi:tigger transposable element-derived protein 1-like [Discoglossus pictus]